uniref:Uncharacterized protein n=1 Tax=Rangifer tarandus platyrhynchus TaxID=3082113 RepID=A0ACB0EHC8_RANTA|nr:unnamed protein product [Rangifer tarandus platyrhynchus]
MFSDEEFVNHVGDSMPAPDPFMTQDAWPGLLRARFYLPPKRTSLSPRHLSPPTMDEDWATSSRRILSCSCYLYRKAADEATSGIPNPTPPSTPDPRSAPPPPSPPASPSQQRPGIHLASKGQLQRTECAPGAQELEYFPEAAPHRSRQQGVLAESGGGVAESGSAHLIPSGLRPSCHVCALRDRPHAGSRALSDWTAASRDGTLTWVGWPIEAPRGPRGAVAGRPREPYLPSTLLSPLGLTARNTPGQMYEADCGAVVAVVE